MPVIDVFTKNIKEFGRMVVMDGLATEEDIQAALDEQSRLKEEEETYKPLGQILVDQDLLSQLDVEKLLDRQDTALEIQLNDIGNKVAVMDINGFVDSATHELLKSALECLYEKEFFKIIVNGDRLDYINSEGIGVLIAGAKHSRSQKGDMKFVHLKGSVNAVFKTLALDKIFDFCVNEDDAAGKFKDTN